MREINIFLVLRVLTGGFFIVSGAEKLLAPVQNFLYVVQNYEFLISPLEKLAAYTIPWIEVFLGIFLVLGLWLKLSLRALLILIGSFILIVGQAMIRGLPIDQCGCFGELISLPLWGTLLIDSGLLLLTGGMILFFGKTAVFSLDRYFGDDR